MINADAILCMRVSQIYVRALHMNTWRQTVNKNTQMLDMLRKVVMVVDIALLLLFIGSVYM